MSLTPRHGGGGTGVPATQLREAAHDLELLSKISDILWDDEQVAHCTGLQLVRKSSACQNSKGGDVEVIKYAPSR